MIRSVHLKIEFLGTRPDIHHYEDSKFVQRNFGELLIHFFTIQEGLCFCSFSVNKNVTFQETFNSYYDCLGKDILSHPRDW